MRERSLHRVARILSGAWQYKLTDTPNALCYYMEPGAPHDELAWKARAWRFLRFLAPR